KWPNASMGLSAKMRSTRLSRDLEGDLGLSLGARIKYLKTEPLLARGRRLGRPLPADGGGARAPTLRPRARLPRAADRAVAVGPAAGRPALLSALCRFHRARHPVLPAGRPHRADAPVRARPPDSLSRPRRARVSRAHHCRRTHRLAVDRGDDCAG